MEKVTGIATNGKVKRDNMQNNPNKGSIDSTDNSGWESNIDSMLNNTNKGSIYSIDNNRWTK